MKKARSEAQKKNGKLRPRLYGVATCAGIIAVAAVAFVGLDRYGRIVYTRTAPDTAIAAVTASATAVATQPAEPTFPQLPPLDTTLYDKLMVQIANEPIRATATSTATATGTVAVAPKAPKWPVQAAYPLAGAVLPFHRIVAYYGNFYSAQMGVLGQYPPAQVLSMLTAEVAKWQAADPSIPVIPAIHYIAVTAQGSPGADGMYRARMPDSQIDKAIAMARSINGLTFLDIQPGLSTPELEVPLFDKYMAMPDVELGIDPEFSLSTKGKKPGTAIGTIDASDINFVTAHLAAIVDADHIPPKILVIHRFTEDMVTNPQNIILRPEVQIVMDMDGWGRQANKIKAYQDFIEDEPVQFAGIKLFYSNDTKNGASLLTPAQVLKLTPQPIYIQYQ